VADVCFRVLEELWLWCTWQRDLAKVLGEEEAIVNGGKGRRIGVG
jgi:hypothetical protein